MLGYYYAELRKKQEEIARLNTCKSSLEGKQLQFQENKYKCLEPDLSINTWNGTLATAFQDIRETGIETSYVEISGTQFTKAYTMINEKISSLQLEIISIERNIADLLAADD